MAITSGFFDSVDGDRTYDADQMSTYFDGLISNGVYENVGDRFLVSSANNGMNINVGSGRAIIKSHWINNDATEVITLDPADVQLSRVDAIALRYDTTARAITLTVKKGTPAQSAALPEITRTETVYELYIAAVYIQKGATKPTMIQDLRPSTYCGWVTGLVKQVDTSDLFRQWQTAYAEYYTQSTAAFDAYMNSRMTAFNSWFAALTQQLTVQTGVTKLFYRYKALESPETIFAIPFTDFDPTSDILMMYVDGVYFEQNYDYAIKKYDLPVVFGDVGTVWYYVQFNRPLADAELTFVVLRNVIGENVIDAPWSSDVFPVSNGGESNDIIAIAEEV